MLAADDSEDDGAKERAPVGVDDDAEEAVELTASPALSDPALIAPPAAAEAAAAAPAPLAADDAPGRPESESESPRLGLPEPGMLEPGTLVSEDEELVELLAPVVDEVDPVPEPDDAEPVDGLP